MTHSSFLHYTFGSFGLGFSTHIKDEIHRWFENCEMRSLVVANTQDPLPDDRLHWRGGANTGIGH